MITVNEGVENTRLRVPEGIRHTFFVVKDIPASYDFTEGNRLLAASLQRGNVLIHCANGHTRSPALVLAYLMERQSFSLKGAMDFLRGKRFEINPILSVKKALKNYELILNGPHHE